MATPSRLFRYDDWANREEVARLSEISNPPERVLKVLAHIVGTEWTWLARLEGSTPKMATWPDLTIAQCAAEFALLRKAWEDYLAKNPSGEIEYRNTKGLVWKSDVDDVLTHVAMHGAYHRGQIATLVRGAGEEPAYTDYIQCTRIGAI